MARRWLSLTGPGFFVCLVIAVGYGLWALYASGARIGRMDATGAGPGATVVLGPVALDPGMNPMRAVLRAGYAPVGSARMHYRIELVDPAGAPLWSSDGTIGGQDDEASIVWRTSSLATFNLPRADRYLLRVRFEEGSMDDLREASVELRRNVVRVDPRIPWSFGLLSAVLLVTNVVGTRRRPWPYRSRDDVNAAA